MASVGRWELQWKARKSKFRGCSRSFAETFHNKISTLHIIHLYVFILHKQAKKRKRMSSSNAKSTLYWWRYDNSSAQFLYILEGHRLHQVLTESSLVTLSMHSQFTIHRFIRSGKRSDPCYQIAHVCNYAFPSERSPNPQNLHSAALGLFPVDDVFFTEKMNKTCSLTRHVQTSVYVWSSQWA